MDLLPDQVPLRVPESYKKNYMTLSLTIIDGIIDELKIHLRILGGLQKIPCLILNFKF